MVKVKSTEGSIKNLFFSDLGEGRGLVAGDSLIGLEEGFLEPDSGLGNFFVDLFKGKGRGAVAESPPLGLRCGLPVVGELVLAAFSIALIATAEWRLEEGGVASGLELELELELWVAEVGFFGGGTGFGMKVSFF